MSRFIREVERITGSMIVDGAINFGRSEYALHELAHWLTLGCPDLGPERDLTDYIDERLSARAQDLNELDALAVEMLVLDHFPRRFGHRVDQIRIIGEAYDNSNREKRLRHRHRSVDYTGWPIPNPAVERGAQRWFKDVEKRKEDPFIQACAESICIALEAA